MRPALKLGSKNSKLHIFQLPSFAIMLSATFFILDAKHETKLEPFILSHTLAIHPYQSIMFCLVLTAVLFSFLSAARSIFPRVLLFFSFFPPRKRLFSCSIHQWLMIALDYSVDYQTQPKANWRGENLILIKVHDYIDNYSGEITASVLASWWTKINKPNFWRCLDR